MTIYKFGFEASVDCDRCTVHTNFFTSKNMDDEGIRTYMRGRRNWALVRFHRGNVEQTLDLCHRCAKEVALALTGVEDKA